MYPRAGARHACQIVRVPLEEVEPLFCQIGPLLGLDDQILFKGTNPPLQSPHLIAQLLILTPQAVCFAVRVRQAQGRRALDVEKACR